MVRVKRNKSYRVAKLHDRRSPDLPRNAEVAAVEVDNPFGLEPGEKIVTLRSIRNDPLGRSRTIGSAPSGGRKPSIPVANMSMACVRGSRSPRASARPCCGSIGPSVTSALMDPRWCMTSWSALARRT